MPKFADLVAKAEANRKTLPPYVIDDVDPPIVITQWDDLERTSGLQELVDEQGKFDPKHWRRILQLFCGDQYDRVWELFRRQHASIRQILIDDLIRHFQSELELETAGDDPADEVVDEAPAPKAPKRAAKAASGVQDTPDA